MMSSIWDMVTANIRRAEDERQATEDKRARRRNINRELMLLTTVIVGVPVVFILQHMGRTGAILQPYGFTITALFDSLVTLYALLKKI